MQYLCDENGRRYLDALRRHRHGQRRALPSARGRRGRTSRTKCSSTRPRSICTRTSREYAQKLAAKMPGDLKVLYFVNSGSEANDLALLMARLYTGNYDMIALRNALSRRQRQRHGAHRAQHLEIQRAAQLRRASRHRAGSVSRRRAATTIPRRGENTPTT